MKLKLVKVGILLINEKIYIDPNNSDAYLETFVPDTIKFRVQDALLIIPGGGYSWICNYKEGEPVALEFASKGYACFVLHYSVSEKAKFPLPLIQASLAMKHIRDNAQKYNLDPDRVFAIGFSAGGHLCASLGSLWHSDVIYQEIDMPFGYNKPKATILIYPVITSDERYAHMGSFYNLLGSGNPSKEELSKFSLEKCVSDKTVPAFLMHTASDDVVNVNNSLLMAQSFNEYKIPFEMHIFPSSRHGCALGSDITADFDDMSYPSLSMWPTLARMWMERIK